MSNIKLKFFTNNASAFRYSQPRKASECKPNWYKELPNPLNSKPTQRKTNMKYCAGFNDLFQKGLMLPMWTEAAVRICPEGSEEYEWKFSSMTAGAQVHDESERGSYLPNSKYAQLKFLSPWRAYCEEPVQFIYMQNTWITDTPEDTFMPTGILEFNHNHALHMNTFFKRHNEERFVQLDQDHPYIHLIPLSERAIEFECELVSNDKWTTMMSEESGLSIIATNYKQRKSKHDNGCPFLHSNGDADE